MKNDFSSNHPKKESKIQTAMINKLKNAGYFVLNLIITNKKGIPDLLAIRKSDQMPVFIEVKKPSKSVISEIQKYRITKLRRDGFVAIIHDNADDLLDVIEKNIGNNTSILSEEIF